MNETAPNLACKAHPGNVVYIRLWVRTHNAPNHAFLSEFQPSGGLQTRAVGVAFSRIDMPQMSYLLSFPRCISTVIRRLTSVITYKVSEAQTHERSFKALLDSFDPFCSHHCLIFASSIDLSEIHLRVPFVPNPNIQVSHSLLQVHSVCFPNIPKNMMPCDRVLPAAAPKGA
jgi:hypothetical protein